MSYLLPELREVKYAFEATHNCFYVFNGNGYPSLLDNHLKNSIADINDIGQYDYLVICLDADNDSVDAKRKEVIHYIQSKGLKTRAKIIVIVQNRCIESWFLGNRKIYTRNPNTELLRKYTSFYNVKEFDPELMGKLDNFATISQFHEVYLSELLAAKNIRYTKRNPAGVVEQHYLNELIKRVNSSDHLKSLKYFLDFCSQIKNEN